MDEELDRAIDAALDVVRAVKPVPDFLPRVRAHVEHMPARAPIRWWIPFAASVSAVAAGAIVAALARTHRGDMPVPVALTPLAARSAPVAPIGPEATRVSRATESSDPRPVRAARRARAVAPERDADVVLVPPGQLAAIGRLLDAINAGDEHAASTLRKLGGAASIVIEPIQIEPVAVPPLKESM